VLGLDTYEATKSFAAAWVSQGRVMGVFLEGGTAAQQGALAAIARERPHVSCPTRLAKLSVEQFLQVRDGGQGGGCEGGRLLRVWAC
jgi:hypothetical protein